MAAAWPCGSNGYLKFENPSSALAVQPLMQLDSAEARKAKTSAVVQAHGVPPVPCLLHHDGGITVLASGAYFAQQRRYPDNLQAQVREIIGQSLPSVECCLGRVATTLELHPRVLQKRTPASGDRLEPPDRGPVHYPPRIFGVGVGAVQQARIVPYDQVALLPVVAVGEPVLGTPVE